MKSKIISILTIISLLSCFFFMTNVKADTLQEQKEKNQEKKEEADKCLLSKKDSPCLLYFLKHGTAFW